MPDEVTFMDLACLLKITPDVTIEKFGSLINASFFDGANIAGTLKQKSLIDFSSNYAGPNAVVVTDTGKTLLTEADSKATTPFDNLDQEILMQMSGGKRIPIELQNTLNVRSKDLALRLFKLNKQGLLIYELKSGSVELQLTENGYLKAKGTPAAQPQAQAETQAPQPMQGAMQEPMKQQMPPMAQQASPSDPAKADPLSAQQPKQPMKMPSGNVIMYTGIAILVIVIIVVYFVILKK